MFFFFTVVLIALVFWWFRSLPRAREWIEKCDGATSGAFRSGRRPPECSRSA